MTVKTILHMGDPRLYATAAPVEDFDSPLVKTIITDMTDTVIARKGAGIAAPQIAYAYRILLIGVPTPRYPDVGTVPRTLLINPEITEKSEETSGYWEACLSVPNLRGYVKRAVHIVYRGYDVSGKLIERQASGFHARVLQHEMDHLDGVLFPSRVKDARLLALEDEAGFQTLMHQVEEGVF